MEKILIVDDLPVNSKALAMLLRTLGYQAITAESGVAALHVLDEERVGLVLLDVMMPDMSGIEVLRAMRSDPRLNSLPVVIYSATDLYRDEAMELGAKNFVMKGKAETFTALCQAITSQVTPSLGVDSKSY